MATTARDMIADIYGENVKHIEEKHLNYVDAIDASVKNPDESKLPTVGGKFPNLHSLLLYIEQAIFHYKRSTSGLPSDIMDPLNDAKELANKCYETNSALLGSTVEKIGEKAQSWLDILERQSNIKEPEETIKLIDSLMLPLKIAKARLEGNWLLAWNAKKIEPVIQSLEAQKVKINKQLCGSDKSTANATDFSSLLKSKESLDGVKDSLISLIKIKQHEDDLEAKINAATEVLNAYEENEKQVTGRLYAGDLIKSQKHNIEKMLASASEEVQKNWSRIQESLNETDILDLMIYSASWIGLPAITAFRLMASEQFQERVRKNTLTPDGKAKRTIQSLAQNTIEESKNALVELRIGKEAVFEQLPYTKDGKPMHECCTEELMTLLDQCQQQTIAIEDAVTVLSVNAKNIQSSESKDMLSGLLNFFNKYLNPMSFFNAGDKGRDQTIAETKSWCQKIRDFFASIGEKLSSINQNMFYRKDIDEPKEKNDSDNNDPSL